MFHFGFSYVGLIYLLMLFLPNILWTRNKPDDYENYAKNEPKLLLVFERIGEALVCIIVLIFSDFNVRKTYWIIWLALSFLFMLLYEVYWIRYFKSRHRMDDFYSGLFGIPVAGATLPICAFFFLGIYGCNSFLLLSVIILGIGHIGIHLKHRGEICGEQKKKNLAIRILKWIIAVIASAVVAVILFVTGVRNVNYITHRQMVSSGVDEGTYVMLGGQKQYVLMRGMDTDNPVIIYLHGGPSSPDTYVTYAFTDYLVDDYTIIAWDQRGCGRTYFSNEPTDPNNETASFEQAQKDLDELVDYALERFGQEKVILLGHSYGTILGSVYVGNHPDKVSAYIGTAQVVSLEEMDIASYEDALARAEAAGEDTTGMKSAFKQFQSDRSISNMMNLRHLTSKYHPAAVSDKATMMAVVSPYFGVDDFRWFLKQLGDLEAYYELNSQLFDYTFDFDAYERSLEYEMPVYFISGACDWICPIDSISDYANHITAENVQFEIIEGCGHNVQFSSPKVFADTVKDLLRQSIL